MWNFYTTLKSYRYKFYNGQNLTTVKYSNTYHFRLLCSGFKKDSLQQIDNISKFGALNLANLQDYTLKKNWQLAIRVLLTSDHNFWIFSMV